MTTPTPSTALAVSPALTAPAAPLTSTTPWQPVVAAYLAAAVDSPHTRRAYGRHLHAALTALGVTTLAELTGADLARYRAAVTGSGRAPASQSQALAALRSFLVWAGTLGAHQLPGDVIRAALRTPKGSTLRPYHVLHDGEIGRVLAAADTPRDRALLAVLLGGGLRAAEAVALDVSDLVEDGAGGTVLHVRAGKGRRDRMVPVQADVAQLVRAYLAATGRRLGEGGPLFRAHDWAAVERAPDQGRRRLSTRAVGYLVERVTAAAGVEAKAISPHSLRHTYALRALRHGGNVVAVSKLLGHASVTTTQRYVDHLALSELRAAVPALPVTAP